MGCQRGAEVEVGVEAVSKATQGHHLGLLLLREGKVTVAQHLLGPSHRVAQEAGVTPHQGKHTEVPPTKAPKSRATGSPRTASTPPRSHTSLGAAVPHALEATQGNDLIILENTRRKVTTIETSDGSDLDPMSEQAIAMSGTTLGTAGIGGEVWGFWRVVFIPPLQDWPSGKYLGNGC